MPKQEIPEWDRAPVMTGVKFAFHNRSGDALERPGIVDPCCDSFLVHPLVFRELMMFDEIKFHHSEGPLIRGFRIRSDARGPVPTVLESMDTAMAVHHFVIQLHNFYHEKTFRAYHDYE